MSAHTRTKYNSKYNTGLNYCIDLINFISDRLMHQDLFLGIFITGSMLCFYKYIYFLLNPLSSSKYLLLHHLLGTPSQVYCMTDFILSTKAHYGCVAGPCGSSLNTRPVQCISYKCLCVGSLSGCNAQYYSTHVQPVQDPKSL